MKIKAINQVHEQIKVLEGPYYPGYYIFTDNAAVMIDAGINLLGPSYYRALVREGADRIADLFLLLTHSHYDHLGAAAYLKKKIPHMVIGGHQRIKDLLNKESVLKTMNYLSEHQASFFPEVAFEDDMVIDSFPVGKFLKEGDVLEIGTLCCRVFEFPGHTRDCLGYYFPELKAFFPGDTAGLPVGENGEIVAVQFLSSYDDYVASIEKMLTIPIDFLGFGHFWVFTGDDVKEFLSKSIDATKTFMRIIEKYLVQTHGDVQRVIDIIMKREYDDKKVILQERNAFKANLTAQVTHIAKRNTLK